METITRPTFQQTVDVLVKAYLNDTLRHRECAACAVGNIIGASGYPLTVDSKSSETYWLRYIETNFRSNKSFYDEDVAIQQIDSTGYTAWELSRIEQAFESTFHKEDAMFNGLMAVVDVLAEIHNIDLSVKEEAKALFVKA